MKLSFIILVIFTFVVITNTSDEATIDKKNGFDIELEDFKQKFLIEILKDENNIYANKKIKDLKKQIVEETLKILMNPDDEHDVKVMEYELDEEIVLRRIYSYIGWGCFIFVLGITAVMLIFGVSIRFLRIRAGR